MGALTRGLWFVIALIAGTLVSSARAEGRAPMISLELAACEAALDGPALFRQLGLELRALDLTIALGDEPADLTLMVAFPDCAEGARAAELHLRTSTGVAMRQRRLDMSDTAADDRPRALSLSASELVRSFLPLNAAEAPAAAAPAEEPAQSSPVSAANAPATNTDDVPPSTKRKVAPPLRLRLAGASRRLFDREMWLSGASVQLGLRPSRHLELGVGLEALTGRDDVAAGRYRVASVLSELALDGVWGERLTVRAGPRFLLGESFARGVGVGSDVTRASVRDLSVGLGAALGADWRLSERLALSARIAGGTFVHGLTIRVDGKSVASTRGPWLDAALGVVLSL